MNSYTEKKIKHTNYDWKSVSSNPHMIEHVKFPSAFAQEWIAINYFKKL